MMVERIDKRITLVCQIGIAAILGWMASSSWHQTYVTDRAALVLPSVQAEAGCEHWRAKVASQLALGANLVAPSQIPKDCAHPKIDPPVGLHQVPK